MAALNGIARALIRMAFGTALSPGSHEEALVSYLRAAELKPDRLIHRCTARALAAACLQTWGSREARS